MAVRNSSESSRTLKKIIVFDETKSQKSVEAMSFGSEESRLRGVLLSPERPETIAIFWFSETSSSKTQV